MAETIAATTVNLGSTSRIPVGQGRCYVVGAEEIAMFRQRDGRLFATQNRCPHRQGPLSEGVMGGGHVICPLHAHRFNLENGAGSEPGECVKVYGIKERKGEILLSLCDRRGAPPEAASERENVERETRAAPL
jgi:nitrite reductase (NADH) small subunit